MRGLLATSRASLKGINNLILNYRTFSTGAVEYFQLYSHWYGGGGVTRAVKQINKCTARHTNGIPR